MNKKWTKEQLIAARDLHKSWIDGQPGVYGTAVGNDHDGRLALKIFVNGISADEMVRVAEPLGDIPLSFVEPDPTFVNYIESLRSSFTSSTESQNDCYHRRLDRNGGANA